MSMRVPTDSLSVEGGMTGKLNDSENVLAFAVLVLGLFIMLGTMLYGASKWAAAADVAAVMTAMGSLVGSLVGAFFGLLVGGAGRRRSDRRAASGDALLAWLTTQITETDRRTEARTKLEQHYAEIKQFW